MSLNSNPLLFWQLVVLYMELWGTGVRCLLLQRWLAVPDVDQLLCSSKNESQMWKRMEERELCVQSWREMKDKKRKVEDGKETGEEYV